MVGAHGIPSSTPRKQARDSAGLFEGRVVGPNHIPWISVVLQRGPAKRTRNTSSYHEILAWVLVGRLLGAEWVAVGFKVTRWEFLLFHSPSLLI